MSDARKQQILNLSGSLISNERLLACGFHHSPQRWQAISCPLLTLRVMKSTLNVKRRLNKKTVPCGG